MKALYFMILFGLALSVSAQSRLVTLSNLDEEGLSGSLQSSPHTIRLWGYSTGGGVGCFKLCNPKGSASHSSRFTVDGDSLQLSLEKSAHCSRNCYGDLFFSNKLYLNDATASHAHYFTLDGYVAMDAEGNANSQALEFTIEQDIPYGRDSRRWDSYIYSWQCNYKGNRSVAGTWSYWDGSLRGKHGDWRQARTTQGRTVPCEKYEAGKFVHYYFRFMRLPNRQIKYLDFTTVDSSGVSKTYQFDIVADIQQPRWDWQTGLKTAIQLDGDSGQNPYSVWIDKWVVAYQ